MEFLGGLTKKNFEMSQVGPRRGVRERTRLETLLEEYREIRML